MRELIFSVLKMFFHFCRQIHHCLVWKPLRWGKHKLSAPNHLCLAAFTFWVYPAAVETLWGSGCNACPSYLASLGRGICQFCGKKFLWKACFGYRSLTKIGYLWKPMFCFLMLASTKIIEVWRWFSMPESWLVLLPSQAWRFVCHIRLGINEKKKPFGFTFVFIRCRHGMLM